MMKKTTATSLTALLLASLSTAHAATTVSYDFESGEQGWNNVSTPLNGFDNNPTFFESRFRGGSISSNILLPDRFEDDASDGPHWARSPEFTMPTNITFTLHGGDRDDAGPANTSDPLFSSGTINGGGFQGLALRRVSDNTYLISDGRTSNGDPGQIFTWDAVTLAGLTAGDAPGETYSLDLIDSAHGGWGWVGLDNVSITSTAIPEPSSLALLGLGGFALLRRCRK